MSALKPGSTDYSSGYQPRRYAGEYLSDAFVRSILKTLKEYLLSFYIVDHQMALVVRMTNFGIIFLGFNFVTLGYSNDKNIVFKKYGHCLTLFACPHTNINLVVNFPPHLLLTCFYVVSVVGSCSGRRKKNCYLT